MNYQTLNAHEKRTIAFYHRLYNGLLVDMTTMDRTTYARLIRQGWLRYGPVGALELSPEGERAYLDYLDRPRKRERKAEGFMQKAEAIQRAAQRALGRR